MDNSEQEEPKVPPPDFKDAASTENMVRRMIWNQKPVRNLEKKGELDLTISLISVLSLIVVLLVVGCCFIHYKMMISSMTVTKETKSVAIHNCHVERTVLLSPSKAMLLTASPQQPLQPIAVPMPSPKQSPQPIAAPTPSPKQSPQPIASSTPSPRSTPSPKYILAQSSVSHIYKSHSSISFHSDEQGSVYSVDHFDQLDGSSQITYGESLDSSRSTNEEEGESSESESIILCAIHSM